MCNNSLGSFECSCQYGFSLDRNLRNCSKFIGCPTKNDCDQICILNFDKTEAKQEYYCYQGYFKSKNSSQCFGERSNILNQI